MELKDFLNLLSLGGIITVLALTEFTAYIIRKRAESDMTEEEIKKAHVKMPWWFICVPAAGGVVVAVLEFFVLTPLEDLQDLSLWMKFAHAALKGILGFAGAIFVFEARKQAWKFIIGRWFPKGT